MARESGPSSTPQPAGAALGGRAFNPALGLLDHPLSRV